MPEICSPPCPLSSTQRSPWRGCRDSTKNRSPVPASRMTVRPPRSRVTQLVGWIAGSPPTGPRKPQICAKNTGVCGMPGSPVGSRAAWPLGPSSSFSFRRSFSISSVFDMKASAPTLSASDFSSSKPLADRMKTGIAAVSGRDLTALHRLKPSIPGIMMSRIRTRGFTRRMTSTAPMAW